LSNWTVTALAYALAVGVIGITIKFSLRHVEWPVLLLSTTIMYLGISGFLAVTGQLHIGAAFGSWSIFILITGALAAGAFALLLSALGKAPASQVVPITAGYPIVTAILAAIFLSEPIGPARALGIVLIVAGAILVSL
jgi:transporter family protein